jgi:hypothetical protein
MPNKPPRREVLRQLLMDLQIVARREGTPTIQAAVLRVTSDVMQMLDALQRIESESRHFSLTRDAQETLGMR